MVLPGESESDVCDLVASHRYQIEQADYHVSHSLLLLATEYGKPPLRRMVQGDIAQVLILDIMEYGPDL
jgi:hypothetical protein